MSLEERIVAALGRLTMAESTCERHMFVFPMTSVHASVAKDLEKRGRVVEDDIVMLVCGDEPEH